MKTVQVSLAERSYPIFIGKDLWSELPQQLPLALAPASALLVSDTNVYPLYGDKISAAFTAAGFKVTPAVVPAGEGSKTLARAEELYTASIKAGLDRASVIVALGGGVVGDLAGFIAATYLRGVPFVQIPTSLLAQVDSSVGGKVAVNHPLGKNLIGAFYQPKLVWIELEVLATLPQREFLAGAAEVVKYGAILSEPLWTKLEQSWPDFLAQEQAVLTQVIIDCCTLKAEVVAADERETGWRTLLNFGHTLGHALEAATRYTYYLHGEAVLVGMTLAVQLALQQQILAPAAGVRLLALFRRLGIKPAPPTLTAAPVLAALQQDKKRVGKKLPFIFPLQIGQASTFDSIPPVLLSSMLQEYLN
ncbi:MAG TPA: 3-dehydroquinate synthase [Oscillospiraceae bacterium]|nr:3-dehydroquinate synthase [Oscillospiraceae bacterium]